jgi:hypothetical protein
MKAIRRHWSTKAYFRKRIGKGCQYKQSIEECSRDASEHDDEPFVEIKRTCFCIGALYRTQTSDDTEENRRYRICKQITREDGRSAKEFGVNGYVESARRGSTRNLTRYVLSKFLVILASAV